MTDSLESIWKKCLNTLSADIQPTLFNAYIMSITPLEITEDIIAFEVPEAFLLNTIENKFYPQIRNAITLHTGKEYRLHFYLPDQYKKKEQENKQIIPRFNSHLNGRYTFDSFITGNSNRMAYAAAVAISSSPGKAYNPLFIYGQSGLGKTHLMHAIGNEILNKDPNQKVLYVTSETFTNEFIEALEQKKNDEFRNKYRKIDVLLIDDIQFISRRERTQEEFFYTFNSLYSDGKQIVVSSDRPINEISILEDRLRTRFAWGLIADIQAPDFETKVAILKRKADENNIIVEKNILEHIAFQTGDNIRELEGIINHLTISSSQGRKIDLNLAREALRHLQKTETKEITPKVIIDVVSRYYNLTVEDILSKKRNKEIAFPRQIAMYLCRELSNLSFPEIGEAFGGKNHTTVMYAHEQITKKCEESFDLRDTIEEIKKSIVC
ncbi:MAG TPA: chromosomal replication initiator protein DnaA [Clostridia bacterium]|jgi:chromosomal replication initiator protein|nr:chromosomal replication initiator protein DnaA [Clostridiaceae bacterium]HOA30498.1 chromosomal replication initiator protein DnaA [Clostridia bacterium]HPZ51382.1 chromosomal replication initiator protein DnaA [Clostridia bacterium]